MAEKQTQPDVRHVRASETLAIYPKYLRQSRDAFFWLFGPSVEENERVGSVAIVHVRGPLEHHAGWSDSYDAIVERVRDAFTGQDVCKAHERRNYWREGYQPLEPVPAETVVLCLDSPGGVVSGLTQTVEALRKCVAESGKKLVAYVDEMAASAAYALACACSEIVVPSSAITGSIGVISTMCDQVARDEEEGYRFAVIASGTRKTDGHPHVALTDAAIAAEQRRVDKLAKQFYRTVKSARGLPLATIEGFQAAIFLGDEAVRAGLADRVAGWDEFLAGLSTGDGEARDLTGLDGKRLSTPNESEDRMNVDALIVRTEAAIKSEKDTAKRVKLLASLDAYKKTKHEIEKKETEEFDDDDSDEDDEDDKKKDDDDDDKEASAAPKKSKSKKAEDGEDAESESEGEDAESDDGDEEALAALVRRATGKRGAAAQGAFEALMSKAKAFDGLSARLARIEKDRQDDKRNAVVDTALAAKRITKKEAARLRTRSMAHVEAFLEARPNSLVYSTSDELPVPIMQHEGGSAVLPPDLQKQLDMAVAASDGKIPRETFIAEFQKRMASLNGRGSP